MAEAKTGSLSFLTDNAITATVSDFYAAFSERRKALKLTNPGTVDNIAREIQKDVLCTSLMFQGLRADFQKVFSLAPLFRIQHGFQMGPNVPSPYNLMALYGTPRVGDLLISHFPVFSVTDYYRCSGSSASWHIERWGCTMLCQLPLVPKADHEVTSTNIRGTSIGHT